MEKRRFESIGREVSLLGFGCMRFPRKPDDKDEIEEEESMRMIDLAYKSGVNYFDTAWTYVDGKAELFTGKALLRYPRESFMLATKMPSWEIKEDGDVERIFNKQLEKLRVDYFDFYLAHNMNREHFAMFEQYNIYDYLKRMKDEGKIRHLGFSFHDTPAVLERIINAHEWDFVQIQLNYLDWELQDAKTQYDIITKHGLPVIVMEPVRGGALAKLTPESAEVLKQAAPDKSLASWAVRYAASNPGVMTVLSGMSSMEQVEDNLATMNDFTPLAEDERAVLKKALDIYNSAGTVPCTGCHYCVDCPMHIDIPHIISLFNNYAVTKRAFTFKTTYSYIDDDKRADACVNCRSCMEHCPQHIVIPDVLKEVVKLSKELGK